MVQHASSSAHRALSADRRREYDERGFTVVPDVFSKAELSAIDREIERLLPACADQDESRKDFIFKLGLRSQITRDMCADARLLGLIEGIVKPGIAIYSAKLVAKPPGLNQVCHWHQDDAYYNQNSQSRTRMSVWIPLQESSQQNGGVWFVPGSHKRGLREHAVKKEGMCRLSFDPRDREILGAVCPTIAVGSVVLFSALTWHHSGVNPTDRIRRAFIVSYQEATVRGGNGAQWKILRPVPAQAS